MGLCTYTHARARVRASARLLFRKQNKVGSDTLTSLENKTRAVPRCLENKTRSVMFRKQNKGRDEKTSQRLFSVVGRALPSYLKSGKRSRAVLSLCIRTHTRALAPFFLFLSFLIRKNSFFFFILSLYISFFFFFFL